MCEDTFEVNWEKSRDTLLTLITFILESGPMQSDNLRTLLSLLISPLLFPMRLFRANEFQDYAAEFLNVLVLTHKFRSKKPQTQGQYLRQQSDTFVDPIDTLRQTLDEHFVSSFGWESIFD